MFPADPPCCICLGSVTTGLVSMTVLRQRALVVGLGACSACSGSGRVANTRGAVASAECQCARKQHTVWQPRQTSENISEPGRTAPNSPEQRLTGASHTHRATANTREHAERTRSRRRAVSFRAAHAEDSRGQPPTHPNTRQSAASQAPVRRQSFQCSPDRSSWSGVPNADFCVTAACSFEP